MKKKPLKEKLKKEIAQCKEQDLQDHFKRGAVLIVKNFLSLEQVGVAMATDQVDSIKNWLEKKWLIQQKDELCRDLENGQQREFAFLIIQPYVLIQALDGEVQ